MSHKEVKITDAVTFLPLAHNGKRMEGVYFGTGKSGRTEVQNAIIKEQFQCAGYDIMTAGKQLLKYIRNKSDGGKLCQKSV